MMNTTTSDYDLTVRDPAGKTHAPRCAGRVKPRGSRISRGCGPEDAPRVAQVCTSIAVALRRPPPRERASWEAARWVAPSSLPEGPPARNGTGEVRKEAVPGRACSEGIWKTPRHPNAEEASEQPLAKEGNR